ncbi:MAG: hypothetical protein KatS3mg021_1690 [Fimbriimonadales bacterium]|nr:MAG: hypothetical protein KatS3mg018_2649 [Fimbriimonadales bacterium]GIV13408.1 MAG: hypothetical protein KatS3mg021_1690 [Fimbriimonadales bacterium]
MILLPERYLIALLNQLGDRVSVHAPLLQDAQLFTVDLSGSQARIEAIISARDYHNQRDAVKRHTIDNLSGDTSLRIDAELPKHDRLRDAFRAAGIVPPTNLDALKDYLRAAAQSDPARGGDIYYFAFDNNALRNRLYSLYLKSTRRDRSEPNLLLSRAVREELDTRGGKILSEFLEAFNRAYQGVAIDQIFANQNRLDDRLRLMALAEYRKVLQSRNCEELPAADSADADGRIIDSYAGYANAVGRKVVVLSSDNEFILRCEARPNLIPQMVAYPLELDAAYETDWEALRWLLYQLAVVYGRLDLQLAKGAIVRVYGVWKGKTEHDWLQEHVKITITPSSIPLEAALQRTLNILQRV